jgi:glycosyltransferase involved in cell wall biosynthesis
MHDPRHDGKETEVAVLASNFRHAALVSEPESKGNWKLRILLTTYHQAFLHPAGGETELHQLADFINDAGARVDLYGPTSRRLSFYDVVIHFSTHGGGESLLREIKAAGKPLVLIPNFNFFDKTHQSRDVVQRHLDLADLVVLRTHVERELCQADFQVSSDKLIVIPPGIAPAFDKPAEPGLFQSAYGLEDYVLWVGQLAEHKRQLEAIEALGDFDLPLVLIGGYSDKAYYERCKAAASENVRFLPYLQPASEILRSAMQSCCVYLELGDDYPGFSALEAALTGAPLVLAEHPWSREIFGSDPTYIQNISRDGLRETLASCVGLRNKGNLTEKMRTQHLQPKPTQALLASISKKIYSQRSG